jgi:hypothetical protein
MPMACQEHLKNPINMSFSLVETGVPGEKPLQAKLRADYFSLPLFLYLQCLKQKELKKKRKKKKELPRFSISLKYFSMSDKHFSL